MTRRRAIGWSVGLGLPVIAIVLLVLLGSWDWFIPLVEARASAAIGRPVTIGHLHVRLGRTVRVTVDDVTIANPPGFAGDPLARIATLGVDVDAWSYIRHRDLIMPLIAIDQPRLHLVQHPDNTNNYTLKFAGSSGGGTTEIGDLQIAQGDVAAQLARLKADFNVAVNTEGRGSAAKLHATAKGTYAGAPITGTFSGGALLSLRDASQPWPMDLKIENGTTSVSLLGTLRNPVHLAGANLRLTLSGQNMANLEPLTGIPIPASPPFNLSGHLDFSGGEHIRFTDFAGRLGSSDLEGTIDTNPGESRMVVKADLASRQVDLEDLGGFVGTAPGSTTTPGQTAATRGQVAQAEARPNLLPDKPISLPRLTWADVHLRYHGARILGKSMPLDNVEAVLDIVNGAIELHPLSFGVGTGSIKADVVLTPQGNELHAKADLDFNHVDVSRLMAATHTFHGAGTINGTGEIDATGRSLAALLANGNGSVRLGMVGGDLSAVLVDLSGLEFGNALLSALGVPNRTQVNCMVADLPLQRGVLHLQPLVVDTGEAIIDGSGTINFTNEALDLSLRTHPRHLTIGSLPAPINVTGTFRKPSILPGAELAVRTGLAAGLGVVFPPLALLPMIQFGTTDNHQCDQVLMAMKQQPGGEQLPSAQ